MAGGSVMMVAIGALAIQLVMILCIVKVYQYTEQINQKMGSIQKLMAEIVDKIPAKEVADRRKKAINDQNQKTEIGQSVSDERGGIEFVDPDPMKRRNDTADSPCCRDGGVDVKSESVVIRSKVSGNVVSVVKNSGDRVWKGDTILTVGSGMMSIPQTAPYDGLLVSVEVDKGERIEAGKAIAKILKAESGDYDAAGIETPEET